MKIPNAYLDGYAEARLLNPEMADNYVAHTLIGDPVADQVVADLAPMDQCESSRLIHAGMQEEYDRLRDAPESLQDFFINAPRVPDWVDFDAFRPGIRAFQRQPSTVLAAFVAGTLIEGFSTLIATSFVHTGRIFDNGVRRLKQNSRHQIEIFFPGGLTRQGDGWKMSVRIRLVHAQVRRLLREDDPNWDLESWGEPLSAAHMGLAAAIFAGLTIKYSEVLGARYSPEERAGFHAVWRYSAYLMGVPESILFTAQDDAAELYRIGMTCEPSVITDAIIMTNELINSAPLVAGIEDPKKRRKLVKNTIYPISRSFIGNKRADELNFPRGGAPAPVFLFKLDRRIKQLKSKIMRTGPVEFSELLSTSAYDEAGISYRLPDNVHAEKSSQW